jgi:hypothetical protein
VIRNDHQLVKLEIGLGLLKTANVVPVEQLWPSGLVLQDLERGLSQEQGDYIQFFRKTSKSSDTFLQLSVARNGGDVMKQDTAKGAKRKALGELRRRQFKPATQF